MKSSSVANKIFLLIIAILAAILVSRFLGVGPFAPKVPKEDICNSIDEVSKHVSDYLESGQEGTLTLYIKDVSEYDLTKINFYIDTMMGSISNIRTSMFNADLTKVELEVHRSDSSYVVDAIVSDKPIPEGKDEAKKLEKKVREIMAAIIKPTMSDFEKELAIHDYIVNNCEYGFFNDDSEREYNAYGVLIEGKAVCSGYAAAMDLLLKCSGVESRFVVGYAESSQRAADSSGVEEGNKKKDLKADNHAWNQVRIDGVWYNVDATWDDPVGKGDVLSHMYFNIDDDLMGMTHEWNRKDYEACSSMAANYYCKTGTKFNNPSELESYSNYYFSSHGKGELECQISGFDVNDSNLQFLFGINGVTGASYAVSEMGDYRILNLIVE